MTIYAGDDRNDSSTGLAIAFISLFVEGVSKRVSVGSSFLFSSLVLMLIVACSGSLRGLFITDLFTNEAGQSLSSSSDGIKYSFDT